ncbi:MAG: hydroxypyruvate isomerase family protein [Reinekea forsetii]|jgi:hydroxypyruvate isomerase|uniref:2-oxo-tetronate isomerase n=1 Tax=Reinekea sp. TaxID=1970455 RepID=UPI00257EA9BC|nr:2-oxo-tetronate isomerase [Reinekea sp.]MDO7645346.1 hydroxypyruvate isomerase family protein [Reinekea forsetii]MDO7672885.1 hydroxypyruvate isomerase family protein [Reinekea forsetii]
MPKLAANLSMLFTEVDFMDRFQAASAAGFDAVEYLFPYAFSAQDIRAQLQKHGLVQALFNAPPGDWAAGERGIACIPGREEEFRAGIATALEYAKVLGNTRLHVMAGLMPDNIDQALATETYVSNLRYAAQQVKEAGLTILVEPINDIDMPGYFVNYQEDGAALIDEIDEPNVRLQFDFYHCQMMQGNVLSTFRKLRAYVDHVQIAGVPNRHEPDVGELNYRYLLAELDKDGYAGFVGCEYKPLAGTVDGLHWINKLT